MSGLVSMLSASQKWGLGLLLGLIAYAVIAPLLSSGDAISQDLANILSVPNADAWFGTDQFGRNMWMRLAEALRLSMLMALFCVLTAATVGVLLGIVSAMAPKWVDGLLDIIVSVILSLPGLVLVLIMAAIKPGSFWMLYGAISLVQWIEYFRITRVIAHRLSTSPEVQSSRLMGFGFGYILKRHFLPEIAPQLITLAGFGAASAILMMASLGFVYVAVQPPLAELGVMIVEYFPYYESAPWLLAQPLVVLAVLILSCQLLGQKKAS